MKTRSFLRVAVAGLAFAGVARGQFVPGHVFVSSESGNGCKFPDNAPDRIWEVDPATGRLVQLQRLDRLVRTRILDRLDHRFLNRDLPEFEHTVPTAENIARFAWRALKGETSPAVLDRVRLVETSNNLATVTPENGCVKIVASSRSSVAPTQDAVLASIRAVGGLAGADVETHDGYPGWKPNMDSPVLAVVRGVYGELWEREPQVTAIHAGLECGLLGEKVPGLDMISFGPQIEGAHSPDERVQISSVGRFWKALVRLLCELA